MRLLETTHSNFDRANELTSARLAFSPAHQYRCTVPPDRLSLHMDRTLQLRYLLTGHFPIKKKKKNRLHSTNHSYQVVPHHSALCGSGIRRRPLRSFGVSGGLGRHGAGLEVKMTDP